jgi:hypothetical protein
MSLSFLCSHSLPPDFPLLQLALLVFALVTRGRPTDLRHRRCLLSKALSIPLVAPWVLAAMIMGEGDLRGGLDLLGRVTRAHAVKLVTW